MDFPAAQEYIRSGVDYARSELERAKVSRKSISGALLSLEEVLNAAVNRSPADDRSRFSIHVVKIPGSVSIRVKSAGIPYDRSDIKSQLDFGDELDYEESIVVDNLIEKTAGSNLKISHSKGITTSVIKVEKAHVNNIILVLGSLVLGLLVGVVLKEISPAFAAAASESLFEPVYTMFLNALKMIVGPLVFLSIANSVCGFDDVKSLGKIAAKVFGCYVVTSLMAIGVGCLAYVMFPIGDPALQSAVTDVANATIQESETTEITLSGLLVSIIPSDVISPFLNLSMLQIIFMAILMGIAIAVTGNDTPFANVVSGANDVALKITGIIIKFLPLSVFCSMAKLIISMDFGNLAKVAVWVPSCYLGHFLMLLLYCMILLIVGGMNPLKFIRDFSPAMMTAFATASSNATMPVTLEMCEKKLGISPKIYAFSIPFGATVNMDGCCVTLVLTSLFMAKSFEVPITAGIMISLIVAIMALSMGSPGIPGGNLVNMAIIFPMIGVPAEALSLVMGLYCLIGMPQSVVNVTGDATVTTLVAKSEHLINDTKKEPQH